MESYIKNDFILKEVKEINNNNLERILEQIDGDITLDKIYQRVFSGLNVNLYKEKNGKYYVELKKYIDIMSNLTENQIMNHKYSIDKNKVVKLKDLDIEQSFVINRLTANKRLIEVDGLQTINDTIKRTGSVKNEIFLTWENLCQVIINNLPKLIEVAVKKYFKKELDKINDRADEQEIKIKVLERQNKNLEKEINNIKDEKSKLEKQINENDVNTKQENKKLKEQLDMIKRTLNIL